MMRMAWLHTFHPHTKAWRRLWVCILCAGALSLLVPYEASAQFVMAEPSDTCTDGPQFDTSIPDGEEGVVSSVAGDIAALLATLSADLFDTIIDNPEYENILGAAVTLYIAIYAILFTFGMVHASAYDFSMRIIRIAILAILISGPAWNLFNNYAIAFFNTLVDEVVTQMTALAIDEQQVGGAAPLVVMDMAIAKVISANMVVHLLAMIFTSPLGFLHALLLGFAIWSFLAALLMAVWVYLASLVLRALLFGVAPIFLACILFDRTRHFFLGWLNQILNACLQPILLFTFFTFFEAMIINMIDSIMAIPVCWTEANDSLRGSPFNMHFWRYTIPSSVTETGWEPYGGFWNTPPVDLMAILIFLILAEMGKRFNHVVLMVARDISASSTDLSTMRNAFEGLLPSGRVEGAAAGAGAGGGRGAAAAGGAGAAGGRGAKTPQQLIDAIRRDGVVETFKKNAGDMLTRK